MTDQYFQYAVWGALVLGGGSIATIIAFWMRLGSDISKGREAKSAVKELEGNFNNFRVAVAKEYATLVDLSNAESRMVIAVQNLQQEMRTLNDRLLQILK